MKVNLLDHIQSQTSCADRELRSVFVHSSQTSTPSDYRENAHDANVLTDTPLPAGGGLFRSSGSRPTLYYTPIARVSARLNNRVTWKLEWQMSLLTTLRFHL